MEISDINKVANRKRMNTDVEKLREKVSRETAKIIKLKVAQDTAYWDLKEKLQQVEGNHERLQQNMVEVQMQHETLSGRHQEELRRRPETLNKVVGTRSMCSVLEEYGARLKAGVARGQHDAAALGAACEGAARQVRGLAAQGARAGDRAAADLLRLRQLLDASTATLREKDEVVASLRADGRRSAREYEAQLAAASRALADHEREVSSERAAAREAEERARLAAAAGDALRLRLQEAEGSESEATRRAAALALSLRDNDQALAAAKAAMSELTDRLSTVETQKMKLEIDLEAVVAEAECQKSTIEDLAAAKRSLEEKIDQILNDFETHRRNGEAKIVELEEVAATTGRELDAKTETISRLMSDVRAETEARGKVEAALAAQRRHADTLAREKDEELAKQMSIILETRGDKERLQERIAAMQATIDNIQKELTGRRPAPDHQPERGPGPSPGVGPAPAPAVALSAPLLYDFLSDSSVDGETLDASEVRRRFEALSRAGRPSTRPSTRPAPPPRFSHATISLSQVKNDLKMKDRTFFKNKRFENKAKKPK